MGEPKSIKSICLIYPPQPGLKEPIAYPPLGLMHIASNLKKYGVPVKLVSLAEGLRPLPEADFYGISVLSANYEEVKDVISQIWRDYPKSKIILGGPHPTALPKLVLEETRVNYVVEGEGEYCLIDIINGDISEGVVKVDRIYDLDDLPFPDRGMLPYDHVFNKTNIFLMGTDITTTIVSSRGCPYRCAFCCKLRMTEGVRYRSPGNFVAELEEVREKYGCRSFRVVDDAFSVDRARLLEICDLLVGRNFSLSVILRADTIQDRDVVDYMGLAGIRIISMGVESGDPEVLKSINKRETIEEMAQALRLCRNAGIETKVLLIEGLPGETPKSIQLTKQFMIDNKPDTYTLSKFTPLPGSLIWEHPENYDIKLSNYCNKVGWFYPDSEKSEFRLWLESGVWK